MAKPRVKAGTSKSAAAERRKVFALAYLANGRNATDAAIEAGFSKHSAHVRGIELVKDRNVAALIDELTEKHATAAGLSVERTLREVARLSYVDPRKFFRADGSLIPIIDLDDDTAAAVASMEVLEEFEGKGADRELVGQTKKLKLWDKNASLEKAMKHLGLYEKDNAQQQESLVLKITAAVPVKR